MPQWIIPTTNGNGRLVIQVERGEPANLSIERMYTDEPSSFDALALEDLRRKLGLAAGVSNDPSAAGDPS